VPGENNVPTTPLQDGTSLEGQDNGKGMEEQKKRYFLQDQVKGMILFTFRRLTV